MIRAVSETRAYILKLHEFQRKSESSIFMYSDKDQMQFDIIDRIGINCDAGFDYMYAYMRLTCNVSISLSFPPSLSLSLSLSLTRVLC